MNAQKATGATALKTVNSVRGTINRGLFLLELASMTAVWAVTLGAILLLLKVLGYHDILPGLPLSLTWLPVGLGAFMRSRKRSFSTLDAAAWLELKASLGGTLLSCIEHPENGFRPEMEKAVLLKASIRTRPVLRRLWLPVLFLTGTLLVPGLEKEAGARAGAEALERRIREVEERTKRSHRLKLLNCRETRMIEEKLEGIRTAATRSPEAASEALDGLRQMMDYDMLQKAKDSLQDLRKLSRLDQEGMDPSAVLETLARMLAQSAEPGMFPRDLQESLRRLLSDMNRLEDGFGKLGSQLDERTLQRLLQSLSSLRPEDLARYAGMLQEMDPELTQLLAEALKNARIEKLQTCSSFVRSMPKEELKEMLRRIIEEGAQLRLAACPECGGGHKPGGG